MTGDHVYSTTSIHYIIIVRKAKGQITLSRLLLQVVFFQKVLMHVSYPQTNEPNYFLELDIFNFGDF